jgi:hypothetical protein
MKTGFDFFTGSVLTEGLGSGAGQYEVRNRLFSAGKQIRLRQKRRFLRLLAKPF